jgi:hypothetical protein
MATATATEKLSKALNAARVAAVRAARATEDGGTCNFDSCVLFTRKLDAANVQTALLEAGLQGHTRPWLGRQDCLFLRDPMGGQGNRRTVQADAMCKVLTEAGFDAMVYYQID